LDNTYNTTNSQIKKRLMTTKN